MAKALKYRIEFYSLDNQLCQVDFLFEGYTGGVVTYLNGGARPFVLREFNSNDDLFKPIRPFLAEIQIVTNLSGVSADSFIADQDTDIEVRFWCGSGLGIYWSGFVLQDDFSESYEDTNHILTITASEALGGLKDRQLSNAGVEIEDKKTPLELIEYCLQDSAKPLTNYTIINNLYHTSMSSTLPNTCLNQCLIDPRTFETTPREYEDSYTVLEKVNTAFNQNIFQYENKWVILRLEDLYNSGNIRGYQKVGVSTTAFSKRFDIEVGSTSEVKPIQPQMLRFINRKPKETIVSFNYDRLSEVIKNSSFARGALIATYPTEKWYEVNNWENILPGNPSQPKRVEVFDSKFGALIDNYLEIRSATTIKGERIRINQGEVIKFSIDTRYKIATSNSAFLTAQITLYGDIGTIYTLNQNGNWTIASVVNSRLEIPYGTDVLTNEWNTLDVESISAPVSGSIELTLTNSSAPSDPATERLFKNLDFEILNRVDGFIEGLSGIESKFVKSQNIKFNNNYNLYLNDYISESYKGLIYESDGETPTDFEWYRFRFSGERESFKKQNAITYWSHDRYDRDKIDATFYGLTWNDSGSTRVIGLLNTIKLVNDAPGKIFYISNMKEIDFAAGTWSCTMEEVWDDAKDGAAGVTRALSLAVNEGTYYDIKNVKFLPSSNKDFVVTADDEIIYEGALPITEDLTLNLFGDILGYTGSLPITVNFYLKQNGTIINTYVLLVDDVAPFNFEVFFNFLSPVTINPKDVLVVTFETTDITKEIDVIEFTGGVFTSTSYNVPNELVYDPYVEKYLFK